MQTHVKRFQNIALTFLMSFFFQSLSAQKIEVIYAAPASQIEQNFNKKDFDDDFHKGIKSVKITRENRDIFRKVAPNSLKMAYENIFAGKKMTDYLNLAFEISKGKINMTYILVDDRNGLEKDEYSIFTTFEQEKKHYVWPGYGNDFVDHQSDKNKKVFNAWTCIGELISTQYFSVQNSPRFISEPVLHQTVRAQFLDNPHNWGKIGRWEAGFFNHAGGINQEIVPDKATALEAGFGDYFMCAYNPSNQRNFRKFLEINFHRYLVSVKSPLTKNANWLTKNTYVYDVFGKDYYNLRWIEATAELLEYSPSTTTGFLMYFTKYFDDKSLANDMIMSATQKIWNDYPSRSLGNLVHLMALEMEKYAATPEGLADVRTGELISSIFPIALYDLLTHYDFSDQELRQNLTSKSKGVKAKAIDEYIKKHRAKRSRLVKEEFQEDFTLIDLEIDLHTDFIASEFKKPSLILKASKTTQ